MKSIPTAIPVTIVSQDRSLLRDLTWTLSNFGYRVTASACWRDDALWRAGGDEALWLLDARDPEAAEALAAETAPAAYSHRIAICAPGANALIDPADDALAMGADDVIRLPINIGELLTRLRAGVRRTEFERRFTATSTRDPRAGLLLRPALIRRAQRLADAGPCGLVALGVDARERIEQRLGVESAREITAAAARCLADALPTDALGCALGSGVFVVLLPGYSSEQAAQFAEGVVEAFAVAEPPPSAAGACPTLSAAVTAWDPSDPVDEALDRVAAGLEQVGAYGGGCVLDLATVQQELSAWKHDTETGKPFHDVLARDLMEAFPLLLKADLPVSAGWGDPGTADRPFPPCIPVLDAASGLLGVVAPDGVPHGAGGVLDPGRIEPTENTVDGAMPLSELFEAFGSVVDDYLIVLESQRPVGYLTSEGLASLVVDRIDTGTYYREPQGGDGLSALVVPVEA
ncbi:hypothetical protein Pla175_14140 [Pirellulimonas nuda]|uniref:Response regulatory domain-containing protein n=1 Tax=Pirellulimonas nuda TaxID=2528009 RepID=A0A518D9A5_9BACT|nr:hypothetical protein [Pirellulimonas nuda]QDU88044.1 hypothetical protein Pla175_14140 [Pirellulimonas nuda]